MVICIHRLRANGVLGVYDRERNAEREVIVNIRLEYDATRPAVTDSIDDALDYQHVHDAIVQVIKTSKHRLIETLAEQILQSLRSDTRVTNIELEVEKPGALSSADSVSVLAGWKRA